MPTTPRHTAPVAIRRATAADAPAVAYVAGLDSAAAPQGDLLVAERDGRIVAALAVDSGAVVADPFVRTAAAVDQLRATAKGPRRARRPRSAIRAPRRAAHARG